MSSLLGVRGGQLQVELLVGRELGLAREENDTYAEVRPKEWKERVYEASTKTATRVSEESANEKSTKDEVKVL